MPEGRIVSDANWKENNTLMWPNLAANTLVRRIIQRTNKTGFLPLGLLVKFEIEGLIHGPRQYWCHIILGRMGEGR